MIQIQKSSDGTLKLNFESGYSAIIIPSINNKMTVCVSSQIGCPLGCTFCHTGINYQFLRNLTKDEILNQFLEAKKYAESENKTITSIVFMGMGEPMLNYENVSNSINTLNQEYGIGFKKITLSTIGINLDKLKDVKFNVAISLHSPFEDIRKQLIPKGSKIQDIVEFAKHYSKINKYGLMLSYAFIEGVNDRQEDINQLLKYNWPSNTNFNLIEFNECGNYKPSKEIKLENFKEKIREKGYKSFIRHSRGKDIKAACGMLDFN